MECQLPRKTSSRHLQEGGKERRWHHSSLRVLKRVCRWRRFSGTRARRETRARRIIALTRSPRPSPRPRLTGQPSLFRHVCHAPTFVHPLNRSFKPRRRDLGLEEYYPRFMAQGMDDVDEVRTSRQLDTVLETVGMDCNPGYVWSLPR